MSMSSQAVYAIGIPLILALILLEAVLGARRQVGVQNGFTHLVRLPGQFHERFGKFPCEVLSWTES